MTGARPFENVEDLLNKADREWWSLSERDWLEAFRAHPRIGEQVAAQSKAAQEWSAQEQLGAKDASPARMAALAVGNRKYEERFGFIFIICATGKTSDEMLAALNSRLRNELQSELRIAAEEQRKITRLRLKKLLSTPNS
jgi:OHCU decarboxylase